MSNFRSLLRKWTGRATSRKSEIENKTQIVKGHPQQVDEKGDDHRHGAEGHAFQVNDDPQQVDEKGDDAR
jgi:hypothetical protein